MISRARTVAGAFRRNGYRVNEYRV
jgi:hypothetical protein